MRARAIFMVHRALELDIYRRFYAMCKVLNSVLIFFLLFPRNACTKQTHKRTGLMLLHTQNVHFILISIITVMQSHVFGARSELVSSSCNEPMSSAYTTTHMHNVNTYIEMVWMAVRHSGSSENVIISVQPLSIRFIEAAHIILLVPDITASGVSVLGWLVCRRAAIARSGFWAGCFSVLSLSKCWNGESHVCIQ